MRESGVRAWGLAAAAVARRAVRIVRRSCDPHLRSTRLSPSCHSPTGTSDMPLFLGQFSYSSDAIKSLVDNPEDRLQAARDGVESLGARLIGIWYAFGEFDGVYLVDAPDNTTAMALPKRWLRRSATTHCATGGAAASRIVSGSRSPEMGGTQLTHSGAELARVPSDDADTPRAPNGKPRLCRHFRPGCCSSGAGIRRKNSRPNDPPARRLCAARWPTSPSARTSVPRAPSGAERSAQRPALYHASCARCRTTGFGCRSRPRAGFQPWGERPHAGEDRRR